MYCSSFWHPEERTYVRRCGTQQLSSQGVEEKACTYPAMYVLHPDALQDACLPTALTEAMVVVVVVVMMTMTMTMKMTMTAKG